MKSSLYLENDCNMLQKTKSPEPEMKLNNAINENILLFNRETIKLELQKIEEEIVTLKQVLSKKLKSAKDLRHQLQLSFVNEEEKEPINEVNSINELNNYKAASITEDCKERTLSEVSSVSTVSQKIPVIKIENVNNSLEEVKNAYISMQKIPCKFNPGEKIFAKVKGFVYWPARVNPLPPDIIIPANKIPIFFYGTHEVYFISPTSCWPYDDKNKNKWGKPKSRAHFNQGMTEIENYPTIYQYGVDPTAEDFLAQFYQFKKSNGESVILKSLDKDQSNDNSVHSSESNEKEKRGRKTMNKKQSKSGLFMSVKEDKVDEQKLEKDSTRKRHLSDSGLSGKNSLNESVIENSDIEQSGASINKRHKSGENSLEFMKKSISIRKKETIMKSTSISELEINNSEIDSVKHDALIFKLSEDDEKVEDKSELKLELENNINDLLLITDSLKDAPLDNYCLFSVKPTTRCRIKSNNSLNNKSTLADSKSNNDSDSLSVDSDNPADEDFRPKVKAKRSNKNIKPQKIVKKISKRNTRQTTKKTTPRSRLSADSKIKNTVKDDLPDSLSSISSIEDYKTVDNKQKGFEEKINFFQLQDEKMEKLILKECVSKVDENSLVEPIIMKIEISDTCESTISKDTNISPDQNNSISKLSDRSKDELCDLNKEAFVDVFKIDIIGEENVQVGKSEFSVVEKENCSLQDSNYSEKVNAKLAKSETFIIDELGSESPKKNHNKKLFPIPNVEEEGDLIVSDLSNKQSEKEVDTVTDEEITKLKINLKEIKASNNLQKHNKSPKQNNRKRNRKLSSSSSSSSESSKSESLKSKFKRNKLTERNSESENNKIEIDMNEKSSLSKIQILQNFNADIRSSLILGREDYKTCLERFKSLCEMQINLVSLVKVWQLMDTVKKCRRYKRNEQVKQEAQSVYRRFMEIYSHASKEEINTAQSLLMKYRHQNNVQNQNVGVDSNKINGGLVHGLTMPISVADMFQNKLSFQQDSKLSKSIIDLTSEKASCINKSLPISNPSQPTEVQINEEKMRLLSMDLEAKVSDILNKIEKNADVNPINQRSLSHLLPTTDENSLINLPVHWKTVSDKLQIDRDKIEEGEITDDDDDDVDAIVRRIEEVDIKFPESEPISMNVINTITSSSNPSALDARIENLINNSFISNKEPRFKKTRTSSSRHHKTIAKNSSPLVLSISKPDQHKVVSSSSEIPVSVKPVTSVTTLYKERPMHFISELEEQKDDIEIYDLLGV